MAVVAGLILAPVLLGGILISWFGRETRGSDLRGLDEVLLHAGVAP
jgi:hypothetical protein